MAVYWWVARRSHGSRKRSSRVQSAIRPGELAPNLCSVSCEKRTRSPAARWCATTSARSTHWPLDLVCVGSQLADDRAEFRGEFGRWLLGRPAGLPTGGRVCCQLNKQRGEVRAGDPERQQVRFGLARSAGQAGDRLPHPDGRFFGLFAPHAVGDLPREHGVLVGAESAAQEIHHRAPRSSTRPPNVAHTLATARSSSTASLANCETTSSPMVERFWSATSSWE